MLTQTYNSDANLNLFVDLQDGSGNSISSTSSSLNVYQTAVTGSASGGTAATSSLLQGGIYNSALPTLTNGQQSSLQLDSSGRLLVDIGAPTLQNVNIADFGGTAVSLGQKVSSSSMPVVIASDQSSIPVTQALNTSSTATLTSVTVTNSSVSLLTSNASRKGAIIVNDTTQPIYVSYAATSSTTSFTYIVAKTGGTLELGSTPIYTGAISAITPLAATGKVYITELS